MKMFSCGLAAWAAVAGSAAFAATVENDSLAVTFAENDVGKGRILQIAAKKSGQTFVGAPRALWQIECRRLDDYTQKKIVNAMAAKSVSYARIANGLVIEYRDIDVCVAEMVCRITADPGDGLIRWRFAATPKAGWAVYETDYPSVYLTPSIGASPEDDCVVTGHAKGGVIRYPMDPKREYWKNRHYSTNPGHLASTFGAFYDGQGGLYTDVVDTEGHFKGLLMDRWWRVKQPDDTFKEGDFLLEWRHFEFSPTTYAPPYDVTMRAFGGTDGQAIDWRDAADIYRERTKDCPWNRVKLIDRPDIPAWAKNGPYQMKFNRAWFRHPGLVARWTKEYAAKRFPGVPFVTEVEGWEHHGDWITPEYFPCYPSDADFSAFCRDLRAAGGHVWAWPGGHHWNVRVGKNADDTHRLDYTDLFEREVKQHACADPDGKPHLDSLGWLGGGESATLCPATAYGRDWWNDFVACGLVSRGVGLVQADQDVCARVRDCWSRTHGHAPGAGRWMYQSLRHQFETQLAKTRKIDPWAQFSFEEPNEMYNDILCFQDYRNCRFFGTEWASVFNYLHHEYITPYQPGSEFYSKWYWIAHSAADGQMPRLPEKPDYYFPMPVVSNGGFEEPQLGLAGFVDWYGTKFGQTVVTNDCMEGRYSLGIVTTPALKEIAIGRTLPPHAVNGPEGKVTLQLKSLKANGTDRGAFRVLNAADRTELARVEPPAATGVWQACEATFAVPANVKQVRLEFVAKNGVAYLADDVKLFVKGADGAFAERRVQYGADVRDFAERWVDAYHANAKWLQHGRHLRPPKVACERLPYTEKFRGRVAQLVKPSVFVGAFRSADGEDAFFMVNATDREQSFTLEWKGRTLSRTLPPRGLKFERVPEEKPVGKKPVEAVCVYYPHWHRYPKGIEWFGEKWDKAEWAFCQDAKARVPGQKCPLRPLYGQLDGKNPADVAKEIDLASNAGIDVFLWDWYWYGGEMTMQESLEEGFLKAPNRNKMKFCIMWCYHDRKDSFRDDPRTPKRMLMKLPRTREDFLANIRYCVKFFKEPNYWFKNGLPFFSIYNAHDFVRDMGGEETCRSVLEEARGIARAAGFGGIAFQGMNPWTTADANSFGKAGFDFTGTYSNAGGPAMAEARKNGSMVCPYKDLIERGSRKSWESFAAADVPHIPSIPAGRDTTMRCRNDEPFPWKTVRYPYDAICMGNTPDLFQRYLQELKDRVASDPKQPGAVLIYGWNEYTEGGYIAPNDHDADGALRAVAAVFGRKPANAYTYVNPSTKKLYTIPAADHENVAYGPHAKQKVDVFLPKGKKGPFPVVQYIHGGGWGGGAMEDHILGTSIRMLLDRGIAVVGTGYRYIRDCQLDGVKPPVLGCLDDCENAVRFVQAHAKDWNLDLSRYALAGGSAGACTSLYLAIRNDNALGIRAVAPIIPQTSMDPQEMRAWIPNSTYGAHAFGYRNFDDWLAHRADCLAEIERISPAGLLRRIDAKKAPVVVLQAGRLPKPGELAGDATHSPVFCAKFKEIADAKGVPCEFIEGGRLPCFGDAFVRVAEILTARGK